MGRFSCTFQAPGPVGKVMLLAAAEAQKFPWPKRIVFMGPSVPVSGSSCALRCLSHGRMRYDHRGGL